MTTQTETPSSSAVTSIEVEAVDRALIDASTRAPVMFFYTTALTWLFAATVFGVIASLKMHAPEFLGGWPALTYGRIWPAFTNTLVYGWGCPAAIGTSIWLMARLCRVALRSPAALIIGGIFWNIGVTVGVISILSGNMRPFELLEFPRSAAILLFIAYSLVSVWGLIMFNKRRSGHIYITTWYLLGAFFWFPWLYGAANVMIGHTHGAAQAGIAAWYMQGLLGLFFTSVGLGAVYYLIPKVLGRPIHSYYLASLGFWTQALFAGWTGMTRLTGGPVPAWMPTVSIAATIMMLIPLVTVTVNHVLTMYGRYDMVYYSPTIRFTIFGAFAWSLSIFAAIITSLRSVDRLTHFTQFSAGQFQLIVYAFFTMVMFGSMYYIVPRLVGCEWLSATFIRVHFWGAAYGMGLVILMLFIGGAAQGDAWLDPQLSPALVIGYFQPYMIARTIGWLLIVLAHLIFFLHFLAMLFRLGQPSGEPTLFAAIEEGGDHV